MLIAFEAAISKSRSTGLSSPVVRRSLRLSALALLLVFRQLGFSKLGGLLGGGNTCSRRPETDPNRCPRKKLERPESGREEQPAMREESGSSSSFTCRKPELRSHPPQKINDGRGSDVLTIGIVIVSQCKSQDIIRIIQNQCESLRLARLDFKRNGRKVRILRERSSFVPCLRKASASTRAPRCPSRCLPTARTTTSCSTCLGDPVLPTSAHIQHRDQSTRSPGLTSFETEETSPTGIAIARFPGATGAQARF